MRIVKHSSPWTRSAPGAQCHGATGSNDGPNSDPFYVNANLTDVTRVEINSDGVVFYKIWNGKGGLIPQERMPGIASRAGRCL